MTSIASTETGLEKIKECFATDETCPLPYAVDNDSYYTFHSIRQAVVGRLYKNYRSEHAYLVTNVSPLFPYPTVHITIDKIESRSNKLVHVRE